MRALEIITYIGGAIGALFLFLTMTSSSGAPQEAAGAAIAIAFVAIPYCITATVQRASRRSKDG